MLLINLFELIGTVAFAVSGALVGIQKRLDFFGVVMLATTTAIGGGIIRDVLIGNTPPLVFRNPKYCIIAFLTAVFVWFFYKHLFKLTNVILIFDAIGLGVFTANGAKMAFEHHLASLFVAISLGVVTGTGGGILRDIFALEIPMVFRKEIYATASIAGVLAYYLSSPFLSGSLSFYICFVTTLLIRLVSLNYNLNLPVSKNTEHDNSISSHKYRHQRDFSRVSDSKKLL